MMAEQNAQPGGSEGLGPASEEALLRQWEPVARHLAQRYAWGAEREDLEQVARLALLQAARRFDPARGCRFGTFATATMTGSLLRYLRDQARERGIPRRRWALHGRLSREREAAAQALGRLPTTAELAERLGVSEEDVLDTLAVAELAHPVSLEEPGAAAAGEERLPPGEQFGAPDPQLEVAELRIFLGQIVAQLPERLREIIRQRYFLGQSQRQVGRAVGVSQMQISRLERQALAFLRQELRGAREPGLAAPPAERRRAARARRSGPSAGKEKQ